MSAISIETKKISELTLASALGSDSDDLVIRFADGTGVKRVPVSALKAAVSGDLSKLDTTDKSTLVAALNEVFGMADTNKQNLAPLIYANAGAHNSFYRGKDITANVTDGSFYTHIKDGTFEDIYVGDYFTKTINGKSYVLRVAGCDVYLHRGNTEFTSHHVVVVPDASFGTYAMNSSNTTSGGYVGSAMYTGTLVTWAGYLATAFGSNLLTNRELLTNAISGELPSNWSWYDSKVNLMTSEEVVGHGGFGMSGYNYGFNVGTGYGQLPLFRLAPDKISTRYNYWLRTITCSAAFAYIYDTGFLYTGSASGTRELRPRFLLG